MKTSICLAIICLTMQDVKAQDFRSSQNDSSAHRRQSIGIYATSPLCVLLGSRPDSPRLGVIYRKQSKSNPGRTWRMHGVVDWYEPGRSKNYDFQLIESVTPETVAFRWASNSDERYTLRFGCEWADPKEAFTPVYGVDLITGAHVFTEQRGRITYRRQPDTPNIQPLINDEGFVEYSRDQTSIKYVVGAAFSAGYRYRVQDRWEFLLQISPELYYSPIEQRINRISPGFQTEGRVSDLWFQLRLVEFQMAYRF